MINNILLIVLVIIFFETFKHFSIFNIARKNISSLKSFYEFILNKNKIEKEFENELLFYIKSIFISSIKILLFFVALIAIILIINYFSNTFVKFIFSFQSIFKMTVIYFIYNFLRKKI